MDYEKVNDRLILWVRLLLGVQYLLDGLNWYYKILPFPSMTDPLGAAAKHQVLVDMIASGWMFQMAKTIEVVMGISLLVNRFVPLFLVVSFPIALTTFFLDAMIGPQLVGFFAGTVSFAALWAKFLDLVFFGGCVLVMQVYLMLAYFDHYRAMLVARAEPKAP